MILSSAEGVYVYQHHCQLKLFPRLKVYHQGQKIVAKQTNETNCGFVKDHRSSSSECTSLIIIAT